MRKQTWLASWVKKADYTVSESKTGMDVGPIATALLGENRCDRVCLLTNYKFVRREKGNLTHG